MPKVIIPAKPQVINLSLLAKNILNNEEFELYELTKLAGLQLDPRVFKIIVDLIHLNISPTAVLEMLKGLSGQIKPKDAVNFSSSAPAIPRQSKHVYNSKNLTKLKK